MRTMDGGGGPLWRPGGTMMVEGWADQVQGMPEQTIAEYCEILDRLEEFGTVDSRELFRYFEMRRNGCSQAWVLQRVVSDHMRHALDGQSLEHLSESNAVGEPDRVRTPLPANVRVPVGAWIALVIVVSAVLAAVLR